MWRSRQTPSATSPAGLPQRGTGVMANDRDPRSDLGAWLGDELRSARLGAGYTSQDQLARELGFDRTVIVKAETGARPPSEDVAAKIAEMFPDLCNGLYVRLAGIARRSNGPIPGWFADWLTREREASSIRIWQPIIIPGLLQTADYARALFVGERKNIDDDALDELVAARLARRGIFDKPEPPHLWVVLDESARCNRAGSGHPRLHARAAGLRGGRDVRTAVHLGPGGTGQRRRSCRAWCPRS